jgi:hypothetical protein
MGALAGVEAGKFALGAGSARWGAGGLKKDAGESTWGRGESKSGWGMGSPSSSSSDVMIINFVLLEFLLTPAGAGLRWLSSLSAKTLSQVHWG